VWARKEKEKEKLIVAYFGAFVPDAVSTRQSARGSKLEHPNSRLTA